MSHGWDYTQLTIQYDKERRRWMVLHRDVPIASGPTLGSIKDDAAEIERTLDRRWRHSTQRERDNHPLARKEGT